jgi:hypothetical protein
MINHVTPALCLVPQVTTPVKVGHTTAVCRSCLSRSTWPTAAAAAVAESLSCCDLTITGAADTDWAATLMGKGKPCDDEGHHGEKNGTAMDHDDHTGHDHDDHAGHDHDDHAGHDHDNKTTTANAPATSARSSAGTASDSAAVAMVAAVLAVAALL